MILFTRSTSVAFVNSSILLSISSRLIAVFNQTIIRNTIDERLCRAARIVTSLGGQRRLRSAIIIFLNSGKAFAHARVRDFVRRVKASGSLFFLAAGIPEV